MADTLKASPQNEIIGKLSKALLSGKESLNQYEVKDWVPLLGGTGVGEMLMGKAPELVEDISYKGLKGALVGGNVATGGIGTLGLDPRTLDAAMLAADVVGLGQGLKSMAGAGVKAIAKEVGKTTDVSRREFAKKAGAVGAGAIIAPKLMEMARPAVKEGAEQATKKVTDNVTATAAKKYKYNTLAEYNEALNKEVFDSENFMSKGREGDYKNFIASTDEKYYNEVKHIQREYIDKGITPPREMKEFYESNKHLLDEFSPQAKAEMKQYKKNIEEFYTDLNLEPGTAQQDWPIYLDKQFTGENDFYFNAGLGAAAGGIIKSAGGNWFPGGIISTKRAMHAETKLEEYMDEVSYKNAKAHFYNKKIIPYIKNMAGTEGDPIRLALDKEKNPFNESLTEYFNEQGTEEMSMRLAQRREEAGFPSMDFGRTTTSRGYERDTDTLIYNDSAGTMKNFIQQLKEGKVTDEIDSNLPYFKKIHLEREWKKDPVKFEESFKWLDKVPEDTPIYDMYPSRTTEDVLEILEDGLRNNQFDIKDVYSGKITLENVLEYGYKQKIRDANDMKQFRQYQVDKDPKVIKLDDKVHIKELNQPGDFADESNAMSNSVRGYEPTKDSPDYHSRFSKGGDSYYGYHGNGWEDIKSGRTKVFSLRDSKDNSSIATIELVADGMGGWENVQSLGYQNSSLDYITNQYIIDFVEKFNSTGPKSAIPIKQNKGPVFDDEIPFFDNDDIPF